MSLKKTNLKTRAKTSNRMARAQYKVLQPCEIDGESLEIGREIVLDEKAAKSLVAEGILLYQKPEGGEGPGVGFRPTAQTPAEDDDSEEEEDGDEDAEGDATNEAPLKQEPEAPAPVTTQQQSKA